MEVSRIRGVAFWCKNVASDARYFNRVSLVLVLVELLVMALIIKMVSYTEIDWRAYMQEVEGVINGTYDYSKLQGDTGPLVYPGGFVVVFLALYWITSRGANIVLAQCVFAALYLINLGVVTRIYNKVGGSPPYLLLFLGVTGYRIHSIYVLRLFNDPVAMFLLYMSVLSFINHKWYVGCLLYSLAVSVKMNILLFSPGLLVVLVRSLGWSGTLPALCLCAMVQLLLGAPFLLHSPVAYISGAFNLGRQFMFQWTVNWRFLPEWLFLHRGFHVSLLLCHILLLTAFCHRHWTSGRLSSLLLWKPTQKLTPSSSELVWILFTSNFIGMCVSRSLHYQFYVWYYHTLPLLLNSAHSLPLWCRVLILLGLEWAWNVYPSTVLSSALQHLLHFLTLSTLYQSGPPRSVQAHKHL